MEDGFQAVAKIPYKIALPRRHATASEAATLELLRSKGIPVPKLYSYSASIDNQAGVEYILMEKANGVPIETKWLSISLTSVSLRCAKLYEEQYSKYLWGYAKLR